jgi:hypothetical protein
VEIKMAENNQPKSGPGGKRAGAGRKPGSATKKTREIADKAVAQGITPLEVMLEAMNFFRELGDMAQAAGFAKDAAPYIHPKLAAIEHSGKDGGAIETVSRIELVALTK